MEIFTVKELRVKAKALKIKGIYTMRKAELISAIEQVEKAAHTVSEPVTEEQSKGYAEKSADLLTPKFSAVKTMCGHTENFVESSCQHSKLIPIEQNNQRVLLTSQIAERYGASEKQISENFNANKGRYIEGKHYYCLTGKKLKEFKNYSGISGIVNEHTSKLYLWTEKGALLHAKSLNTDEAWQAYEFLVDHYFENHEEKQALASADMQALINCFEKFSERLDALENRQKRLETKSSGFTPPTVREVEAYCDCLGEWIDAERFVDYYESVGWVIGNGKPMKDWKASVRCWLRYEA